jgi:hypothetical protein
MILTAFLGKIKVQPLFRREEKFVLGIGVSVARWFLLNRGIKRRGKTLLERHFGIM